MEKLVKKILYTGVGLVASTTERLQKVVDEFVEKGKMSEEEGKKVVDDVVKNTETHYDKYENRFRKIIDSALAKLNLPQGDEEKDNHIARLEKRIKSLEVKLGLLSKEVEAQKKKRALANKDISSNG